MIRGFLKWFFPCFLSKRQDKICFHIPCILHWLFRIILAGIFIYSGYVKWESPLLFEAVLYTYDLFPRSSIPLITGCFPWVEMALGLSLLIGFGKKIKYLAGAAAALLLFFIAIITITYFRGIEADCGCFGFDDPISPIAIIRDSLILIPALYLLFADALLKKRIQKLNRR